MRITDQITYHQPKPVSPASVSLVNLVFGDEQTTHDDGQVAAFTEYDDVVIQYSLSAVQPTAATYMVHYQLTIH
jgi:hypothetical protein